MTSPRDTRWFSSKPGRVVVQVRVVVAEAPARIELIEGDAARFADEQLRDGAVVHGVNRRVSRREDVHRFVRPAAGVTPLGESAFHRFDVHVVYRQAEAAVAHVADGAGGWQ